MSRARWFLVEWGVPLVVGLSLAAAVIALGDVGEWLLSGATGLLFGALAWFLFGGRPLALRLAAAGGLGAFAVGWPPCFYAVAEQTLPESGALRVLVQLASISPVLAGLVGMLVGRRRARARGYGLAWWLLTVGLALLLPFPWLETPWRFGVPGVGILVLLLGAKLAPPAAPPSLVRIDAWGVERWAGGPVEALPWEELVAVELRTTGEGPAGQELYWLLVGASGGVTVPGSDPAAGELLARLARLPGFDLAAVVLARGRPGRGSVRCWGGAPGVGRVCAAPARAGAPSPGSADA